MTPDQVAATLIGLAGIFFAIYQAHQAKIQRRMDRLRDLQKELRIQKAEYDGWVPVWKEQGQTRHGAKVGSCAQSVMLAVNDSELNKLAGELKLYPDPGSDEEIKGNQKVLVDATARFAKLLDERWVSEDFRRQME